MIATAELPEVLPVFPLTGALLLPRARLPLHIFEPRYLALLEDVLKTRSRLIGMIQPRDTPEGRDPQLCAIGCAGRLTSFSETEDGRYMVTLTGISRFRLLDEVTGFQPYRRFHINWAPFHRDLVGEESDAGFDRDAFMALLARYFQARQLGTDWSGLKEAGTEHMINALSMLLPLGSEDKQALLEAPSLVTRRETLVTLWEFALRSGGGTQETMQ